MSGGKYVFISSSVKPSTNNKYILTVKVSTSSSLVYNHYGMRVYITLDGKKGVKLGTFTIDNGVCSKDTFTHEFSAGNATTVGAMVICSYCEDVKHSEYYDQFYNKTKEEAIVPGTTEDGSKTPLTVFSDSKFKPCNIKVYKNNKWQECNVKVYVKGAWIETK